MEQNKKELIREAAVKVMAREGFYNTKTAWIAEEAGVAVGTIYNYFDSKEAILEYIFEVELKKRFVFLKDILSSELNGLDKLERFLNYHFQEIKDNPAVGIILVREKEFTRKKGSISRYLNKIPETFTEFLSQAAKDGKIRDINPEVTATIIFGGIQGVVEKAIYKQDQSLLEGATEEIVKLLQ